MGLPNILYPPGATRLDPTVATGLFLILFSTQMTLSAPFSYLPAMVHSFGYSDRERGMYAGMIASSLFVGRFFGGYFWGWLTDKIGRRPVLLLSASLTYATTLAFGFSTTFYFAVTTRFLQGLFNGVIVCGRAAFAEICDDTNQAVGVSLVFAAWNSAIVVGPAIGGFLATPVKKYPNTFTGSAKVFFTKFPFLLPSVLVACIVLVSVIFIFFTFKESRPPRSKEDSQTYSLLPNEDKIDEEFNEKREDKKPRSQQSHSNIILKFISFILRSIKNWSLYELISDKVVMLVTIMFGISGFCIIGFTELSSLWMATNIKYGGLSFSTDEIGIALLVPAVVSVFLQPIIFGRCERKFGGIITLRLSLMVLFLTTLTYPNIHYTNERREWMWFCIIVIVMLRMIADISSRSALALFINNSVFPGQSGRVNGLAFSVQEIMRVASPTLFGSLFSWSINDKKHKVKFPINFQLSFLVLSMIVLFIGILARFLPKSINSAKVLKINEQDEDL